MHDKPNVPCAGTCGRLLWSGAGSLPAGLRMCRACRRERLERGVERPCSGCGRPFLATVYEGSWQLRVVCSDACRRKRQGASVRRPNKEK